MSSSNPVTTPPSLETVSGETIGRDPRAMSTADLSALGHHSKSVLRAVRTYCIECGGDSPVEARKCVLTACPLWPFRMGSNPLARRELSQEQKDAARDRLAAGRNKHFHATA